MFLVSHPVLIASFGSCVCGANCLILKGGRMSQSVSSGCDDVALTGTDFRVSNLGLRASRYDSVGHMRYWDAVN